MKKRTEAFRGHVQVDYIFRHYVLRQTVKEVTAELGISESYGYQMNQKWQTDAGFRARIMKRLGDYPEDYRNAAKSLLPSVFKTEVAGLKAMADNPELIVKHPQLLKQIKQASGITFGDEPAPAVKQINIGAIQQIITNAISDDDDAIDLPVIEKSGDK